MLYLCFTSLLQRLILLYALWYVWGRNFAFLMYRSNSFGSLTWFQANFDQYNCVLHTNSPNLITGSYSLYKQLYRSFRPFVFNGILYFLILCICSFYKNHLQNM